LSVTEEIALYFTKCAHVIQLKRTLEYIYSEPDANGGTKLREAQTWELKPKSRKALRNRK
jgi:hypothetical protein